MTRLHEPPIGREPAPGPGAEAALGPDTLRAVVESISDPYVIGHPVRRGRKVVDLAVTTANRAACTVLRVDPGRITGTRMGGLLPPGLLDDLVAALTGIAATGQTLSVPDYSYRSAGGTVRYADMRISPIGSDVGVTWHDVTDRSGRHRQLEPGVADTVDTVDTVYLVRGGLVEWVSPGMVDLLGWSPAELLGTPEDSVVHPDDRHLLHEVREQDRCGQPTRVRLRYLRRTGGFLWCQARATRVPDADPATGGTVVSIRDMTEAVDAERARDASDSLYRLVAEHASDIVYTTDRHFRFNWVSPSVEGILGWKPAELVGVPTASLQFPGDAEDVATIRERVFGRRQAMEPTILRYRTRSGAYRWMSVRAHPVDGPGDEAAGAVVTLRDAENEVLGRRATDTVAAGNALLAVAEDETVLLTAMCETAVRVGGYPFAWYGRVTEDPTGGRRVEPAATSAEPAPEPSGPEVRDAPGLIAAGPTGRAARTGSTAVEQDMGSRDASADWRPEALAFGFRSAASLPVRVDGVLDGVFTVYATEPGAFDRQAEAVLEDLARTLGFGIGRLRDRADLNDAFSNAIDLVAAVVESRDPYTAGHQALVAELARAVGQELGLDTHRLDGLSFAARIHDVGKVGVPIDLLCRPGQLAPEEMAVVRRHATLGWEIAGHFTWPWPIAEIVHQHHERFDGSGYPQGLRGAEILLEARIVAVADAYQAIASRRPYREALGEDYAFGVVTDGAGTLFDPAVVDAFVRVLAAGFTFTEPSAHPG